MSRYRGLRREICRRDQLTAAAVANQDVMVSLRKASDPRNFVDKGAQVESGAPLAKIDDRILTAQVEQARAVAELAGQTWERRKRLWEEDRIGSEITYLEARFGAEQSMAALRGLEERLARTTIRAPFSGVWDERHVEIGSMVAPGQSVGRLIDLDPVRVVAGVPERYVPDVWVGAEATLALTYSLGTIYCSDPLCGFYCEPSKSDVSN